MGKPLTSPEDALAAILARAPRLPSETLPLADALGRIASSTLPCPVDHPLFDQSAVDGYAFRHADLGTAAGLRLADHLRAGSPADSPLLPGTCARIFTGAALPPGADTVLMQEHARIADGQLHIEGPPPPRGANVRYRGEQARAGEAAIHPGTRLNPGGTGFLASIGIRSVQVARRPRVAVLVTGNEFAKGADDLRRGLIFESNGLMLAQALAGLGIVPEVHQVEEEQAALSALAARLIPAHDLLICTGGVSVGEHDHTRAALEDAGLEVVLHQVAQKPGKPLLFAQGATCSAFGLPGNPRAAMICFEVYVRPWLLMAQGAAEPVAPRILLPLASDYRRKPDGKTHFVTGRIVDGKVQIEGGQGSHMLRSFLEAHVIVTLAPEPEQFRAGELVAVRVL